MARPEQPNSYEHLPLGREEPVTERHRRQDRRPRFRPQSPREFAAQLTERLQVAKPRLDGDLAGYDERRLLKIVLRAGESPPNIEAIPGIELVSQEDRSVVLAFASREGMAEFESRLATLAREGSVTRAQVLYAIDDFDHWTRDDRTGNALREHGFPDAEPFVLDVELWPQERADRRGVMLERFTDWLDEVGIQQLDRLAHPSLVMVKVRCTRVQAEELLLRHRDVRTVDLPPRIGVTVAMLQTDIGQIPPPPPPDATAPAVAVLDSGLTTGHPLIGPAVGDSQGFVLPERDSADAIPNGHGTFVSGLALYGDIAESIGRGRFVPVLRLFSGKVFKDDGTDETEFVERAVEEAVRYFVEEYGCRVFNLSYGDLNKVYDGRHLRGLAYTLDLLTRELDVLFVTSAGNRPLFSLPENPREAYPDYLFEPDGRLLDPGTSLNAITVGGLAYYDAAREVQRYPNDIGIRIAQSDQPCPITRCGPSIGGAIKPDVVEYAGNVTLHRSGRPQTSGLGVVSFSSGFASGRVFSEDVGTSYAAPVVAHKAARLLAELPDASPNLLRALLGAHAKWPESCADLLDPHGNQDGREKLLKAIGYGRIDDEALYRSLDDAVTLLAEDSIAADHHHFFEIPVPDAWWEGGRRKRAVSVALAYTPEVRTTRLDYRATKIRYSLVNATGLDDVAAAFRRNPEEEMRERSANRWISSTKRNCGTLQVSRWAFGGPIRPQRLFLVITRQDATWSPVADQPERYALCAVLEDRERAAANLYAEVRAVLHARARVRIRV